VSLAVPVITAAGAIAAAPHALAATSGSQAHHGAPSAATAVATAVAHPVQAYLTSTRSAAQAGGAYTVRAGDTLSGIAQRSYHHASDWTYLYQINRSKISNPDVISVGEIISVPANPPASVLSGTYRPRHAKPAATSDASASGSSGSSAAPVSDQTSTASSGGSSGGVTCSATSSGMVPANYAEIVKFLTTHGYTGIAAAGIAGNIWRESGGNPESAGSGGGGLVGWTPLPAGFVTGNPAADLQTQLNALLTYNQGWAQFIPALNAATSPAEAALIYMEDFERPGIPAASDRQAAAEAVAAACGI
jgi:LysM repeat protein